MLFTKRIACNTSQYQSRLSPFIFSTKQNIRTMATFLRFVGHSTLEGPPSIIYQHKNDHYMFNCREGTQRLAVEDKVKISKLKNIFFTRMEWECIGGMPGMLLTLADAGLQHVNICGGKNLTHFMASTRFFIYRTSMSVHTREFVKDAEEQDMEYQDSSLKVTPVIVSSSTIDEYRNSLSELSSSSDYAPYSSSDERGNLPWTSKYQPMDDHDHRRRVVNFMFSNQQKSKQNYKDLNQHAMDSPCTPRRQHPLTPASEATEAIVELQQTSDKRPPQALVTPIDQQQEQNAYMTQLYKRNLPKTRNVNDAISYICQAPEVPGKFLDNEAKRLGVPAGPLFGKLQRGEVVTLDDGTVVTKDQVCGKATPGAIFMVIDCPDPSYIENLITSPKFHPYQSVTRSENTPKVIVHLLGADVLDNPAYRQWMKRFPSATEHIISSEAICAQTTLYRSHAVSQYKLSKLDPDIFKVPEYNNKPHTALSKYKDLPPNVSPLMNKSSYNLQPTRKTTTVGQQLDETPPFDEYEPWNDPKMLAFDADVETHQIIEDAKEAASQVRIDETMAGGNVKIVTLGTGSSIPSKYRNVSATLIKIPFFGSVLLDAGEGTYGQMLRHFGRDRIAQELDDLRFIFVSHLHADHHLGVFQLLSKRNKPMKSKNHLFIVGPNEYHRWMKEYNDVEHLGSLRRLHFIRCDYALGSDTNPPERITEQLDQLQASLGLTKIKTVEVIHCRHAYGLSLEHVTGWKLVYSGDTRPCNRLIEAGKDATLLIHEATLEDSMTAEAIAKRHSTTAEAIEVGQKMNARYTLLNHFSQRYAKVPTLSEQQANTCISFDMMSVSISQLARLPKFNDAIRTIFKDDEEEDDDVGGGDLVNNSDTENKRSHNKKKEDRKLKRRKMEEDKEKKMVS